MEEWTDLLAIQSLMNTSTHTIKSYFKKTTRRYWCPCGQSLDMAWLHQQGASIVGVDLVKQPLEQYFAAQKLTPQSEFRQDIEALTSGSQTLFHANIFDITQDVIGNVDAIYDRAALVALSPEVRESYVEHCLSLLKPGGSILLVTYDSPVADDHGPPFPSAKAQSKNSFPVSKSAFS